MRGWGAKSSNGIWRLLKLGTSTAKIVIRDACLFGQDVAANLPTQRANYRNMPVAMSPPWVKHPDIPWGSVGWRMGWGEAYGGQWKIFFLALEEKDRQRYQDTWQEAESWQGLYAFIESGEPPPWAVEQRRKLAGPYPLPHPDESSICEYYRVVWLVRHHMSKLGLSQSPESQQEYASVNAVLRALEESNR